MNRDALLNDRRAGGDQRPALIAANKSGAVAGRLPVGTAFAQAIAALAAYQLPDEHLPRCFTRGGVPADQIRLWRPPW